MAEVLAVGPGTEDEKMELKVGRQGDISPSMRGTDIKYGGEEVVYHEPQRYPG